MPKRKLSLTFALVLPAALFAASDATPATKADSLATKREVVQTPDTAGSKHLGRLSIVSTPPGAEVSVDSVPIGESPVIFERLAPGPHVIIVKARGYFGKKVSVDALADTTIDVAVTLVAPAHLIVTSDPAGATALLDGKEIGATPCDNSRLKPGDHSVRIDKAGFVPFEKQVALIEGKADTISVVLRPVPKTDAAPKRPESVPKKTGFDRVTALVALGAFVLFGAILLGVEIH